MTKKKKLRLDEWLVANNLVDSRSRAKALILAGKVMQETQRLDKPGQMVVHDAPIRVIEPPRFVSRGGEKLAGFIQEFSITMQDCLVLDVGASTAVSQIAAYKMGLSTSLVLMSVVLNYIIS